MPPRFSIDEIKRLYVKVQFKLIILQYIRRGTIIILNMSKAAAWFKEGLTLDQVLHIQNSLGSVAWDKVSWKSTTETNTHNFCLENKLQMITAELLSKKHKKV